MAVPEQIPYHEFISNGSTNRFDLNFLCKKKEHLIVKLDDAEANVGDWTFADNAVVFSTIPANGVKVSIQRRTPNKRSVNYQSYNNSFNPKVVNEDFDALWMRLQEEEVAKAFLNQLIEMNYEELSEKDQAVRLELIDQLTEKTSQLQNQIIQQGVSQQQLQNYYSFLLSQMANLSSEKNWIADLIQYGDTTQKAFNDKVVTYAALEFYVEMWGAKGDGITSDIAAFTNAMNDMHNAYKADGRPRTILIQANKTYVGHLLPLKAGVSIRCVNGMPMFKRTPVPAGTAESVAKWWRIFQVDTASFTTLADISHRIRLENFILDGNMNESNWTWNTYSQEQASCILLSGRNDISINGVTEEWMRARFHLQNVKCQNSVSDGLHINRNVDLTFSNLEFEHCFRGGLTMTGGNSIIKGDSVTAFDARIDLEVDGGGIGGSFKAWIFLKDYWQDVAQKGKERFFTGGCDFGSVNGGVLSLNNVNVLSPPFNMYIAKSDNEVFEKFEILNSIFHSSGENIFRPSNGLFKDTKIILRNDLNADVCLPFLLAYNNYVQKDQDLIFDGLTVEHYDQNITATKVPIRIESQKSINLQRLKFINCDFSNINAAHTFGLPAGGRLAVDNCKVNTPKIFDLVGTLNSGGESWPIDLEVGRLIYGSKVTGFSTVSLNSSNTNVNKLNFLNTEIPSPINNIVIGTSNGIPTIKKGARIILGDIPPVAATQAYKGDIYRLNNAAIVDGKPYEWICTTSVGFSRTASTWKPIKWNTTAYVTANLPVLTTTDVGSQNIDSTLNKLVTWSGTAWV